MTDILQDWLHNKLGLTIKLDPSTIGKDFKDGIILSQMLHIYGLINVAHSAILEPSSDVTKCVQNLRTLQPLFSMLEINFNDTLIQNVAEGKGSAILRLLYEMYLCLENKLILYFITNQKLREVLNKRDSLKFTVQDASKLDLEPKEEPPDSLDYSLIENKDVIDWYRSKFKTVKSKMEKTVIANDNNKMGHCKIHNKVDTDQFLRSHSTLKETTTLSRCDSLYPHCQSVCDLPSMESGASLNDSAKKILSNDEYICSLKIRKQKYAANKLLTTNVQHILLKNVWDRIRKNQEMEYNKLFSQILLKQSLYERQIMTKLFQTQHVSIIQKQNKKEVNELVLQEQENRIACDFEIKENFEKGIGMYEDEQQRVLELHKKLYEEQLQIVSERHYSMCFEVMESIIDMAVKASEFQAANNTSVPEMMWKDWKQLFFKNQPIHVPLENVVSTTGEFDYDSLVVYENEQEEVLNEYALHEYLYLVGPWFTEDLLPGNDEEEVEQLVLGFIVHRLLLAKYPPPLPPQPADLLPFTVTGILLNLHDPTAVDKLKRLLTKQRIHVFDLQMAINYCVAVYYRETAPPSAEPVHKLKGKKSKVSESKKERKKSKEKKKKSKPKLKVNSSEDIEKHKSKNKKSRKEQLLNEDKHLDFGGKDIHNLIDKETQTSVIFYPEEIKPIRTDIGLIGERVNEILKSGNEIDDSLLVSVVIQYIKAQNNIDGWVLLNFPLTLTQASLFELALNGKTLPLKDYTSNIDTIEDITTNDTPADVFEDKRKSKLLPCPKINAEEDAFKTYFTVFIKAYKLTDSAVTTPLIEELESDKANYADEMDHIERVHSLSHTSVLEEKSKDILNLLETFYNDQAIYKEIKYNLLDLGTMKKIARTLLKEENSIPYKKSKDLFGEDVLRKLSGSKKGKNEKKLSKEKDKSKKSLKKEQKGKNKVSEETVDQTENGNQIPKEGSVHELTIDIKPNGEEQLSIKSVHPGDGNWEYLTLSISNNFEEILGTIWENLESFYLQNLQTIFFMNRLINSRLIPYVTFINKHIKYVVDKPDDKQELVTIFQDFYDNIEDKMRPFTDMKNELYCKTLELQLQLWQITDERKRETEQKRQDIINQNWTGAEICALINTYLSIIQVEVDRTTDTLRLVNDYYLSMLGKVPVDVDLKLNIEKLEFRSLKSDENIEIVTKKKSNQSASPSKEAINAVIAQQLINPEPERTSEVPLLGTLTDNIKKTQKEIRDVVKYFKGTAEKEMSLMVVKPKTAKSVKKDILPTKKQSIKDTEKEAAPTEITKKRKDGSPTKKSKKSVKGKDGSPTGKSKKSLKAKDGSPMKKSIKAALKTKVNQEAEIDPHISEAEKAEKEEAERHHMIERLFLEWKHVIESEEKRINFRIDLVKQRALKNVSDYYHHIESTFHEISKSIKSKYQNGVDNIDKLCDFLRTAIEEETAIEQALILDQDDFYVDMDDLLIDKSDYPEIKDLKELMNECGFTICQLSELMKIFFVAGPGGLIRKQPFIYIFQDIILRNTEHNIKCLPLLWNTVNEKQLISMVETIFGAAYAIDWKDFIIYSLELPFPTVEDLLNMRKQCLTYDFEALETISHEQYKQLIFWFEEALPNSPEDTLRIAMAKELLYEMFQGEADKLNYTALLLYFCKDVDPRVGLKKALSLSLGKNVIICEEELRQLAEEEEGLFNAVHSVLDQIINNIVFGREGVLIYEIDENLLSSSVDQFTESCYIDENSLDDFQNENESFELYENDEQSLNEGEHEDQNLGQCENRDHEQQENDWRNIRNSKLPWISNIPLETITSVLAAVFRYQDETFNLQDMCIDNLKELTKDGSIAGHILVDSACITDLFNTVNKFKIFSTCNILAGAIKNDN